MDSLLRVLSSLLFPGEIKGLIKQRTPLRKEKHKLPKECIPVSPSLTSALSSSGMNLQTTTLRTRADPYPHLVLLTVVCSHLCALAHI